MELSDLVLLVIMFVCSLGISVSSAYHRQNAMPLHRRGFLNENATRRTRRTPISATNTPSVGREHGSKSQWVNFQHNTQANHDTGTQHQGKYEREISEKHWKKTHHKRATNTNDLGRSASVPKTIDLKDPVAAGQGQGDSHLEELGRYDHMASVLEHIEQIRVKSLLGNCSGVKILDLKEGFPIASYERFTIQMQTAIRTANVLNNMFRSWDLTGSGSRSLYNDAFYYSLVRAMVENDPGINGATIAFDRRQYEDEKRLFSPNAYRNKTTSKLHITNIADQTRPKGKYTVNGTIGYGWFWRHRSRDYSGKLWKFKDICQTTDPQDAAERIMNSSTVNTTSEAGLWSSPHFDCEGARAWVVSYSVPFFGCTMAQNSLLGFKGVVSIDIDLSHIDIDQCADDGSAFSNTHKCRDTTECEHVPGAGFRRGGYLCECSPGYFYPQTNANNRYFNGTEVEKQYLLNLLNQSNSYDRDFTCLPCANGCMKCNNDSPCFVEYDVMIRGIPLGVESFCMTISLVLGFVIIRLRKTKVMKASMWAMLEILILGALLLYSTVVIQYFEPSNLTCILVPWFREVGFSIVYGALILKVYRVLAGFQSRKAHRVHVRDKDLLKYLCCIVVVVIGYVACWTAINLDHVRDGQSLLVKGAVTSESGDRMEYYICRTHWWDYVIEAGEFLFLCFGIYLCYCTRSAPSDYFETRYVSWAIYNETLISALLHIIRHFLWLVIHPDYIFLMYFVRCQLTVTITLILVLGPKLWYAHRPPEDDRFRHRAYSTSDVHDSILPESMKLHVGVSSNGDVDVGEINLSEMDPEDIRTELKRLYTQLQIYKTKTMRKDNPHISKRRGGRKQTHRRFSLQAFHHKHRHHHEHSVSEVDHEMSKTPEESTNSAEGVAISMEESSVGGCEATRTPTVTFKPGHKSIY